MENSLDRSEIDEPSEIVLQEIVGKTDSFSDPVPESLFIDQPRIPTVKFEKSTSIESEQDLAEQVHFLFD